MNIHETLTSLFNTYANENEKAVTKVLAQELEKH